MLETKNLVKIYRPKKGVPVRALDGVSLKFPDRGMIFLLGKSGSGKSTLLNVLGGLDRYDSGEILIKGVSSKNFRQQDFDIYRNTYVGFIFQEYNVLEEFTVGANIALAIELQNRKATDEEINRILKEVDLEGYGDRKPNELSGGQKQRVAIARALIKNPEIIMADEPTGALDSATGRAVFDTLKKLSSNHLVIVVSHDRDFAVQYADRIIELADGHVVSDLEYEDATPPSAMVDEESKGEELSQLRFEEGEIFIPRRYRLSEADREAINCYLAKIEESGQQARLVSEQKKEAGRKEAPGVKGKTSRPTDVSGIPNGDPSTFRKIKSKLPMKCAFRIGASGLTHKKVRLCITIFLSCVAFVLFGLADTFGSYEHIRTCARSIKDTGIDYATVKKSVRVEMDDYSYYSSTFLTDADLETLQKEIGVAFYGIYTPRSSLAIEDQFKNPAKEDMVVDSRYQLSAKCLSGFSETDDATFQQLGYPLVAGKLPEGDRNELAISQYLCESFIQYGYYDLQNGKIDGDGNRIYETVKSADDMIGKVLYLYGEPYTVSGVFDSHLDVDRYVNLLTENQTGDSTATGILLNYAIMMEFSGAQQNSFAQVALVGKGFISRFKNEKDTYYLNDMGNIFVEMDGDSTSWADQIKSTDEIPVNCEVIWKNADAEPMQRNEYLISLDMFGAEINWDDVYSTDDESQQMASLKEQVKKLLNERSFRLNVEWYDTGYVADEYVIAGVVLPKTLSASGDFPLTLYCDTLNQELVSRQSSVAYGIASGRMPESEDAIRRLVSVCYQENEVKYPLQNPVTFELDTVHDVFQVLSKVFLYIGIGFALFASMMLANFIGTSIAYKKQEIGILRAIGARSNDVFRIFFAESFLIAMINFVLSSVGVALLTFWINVSIRNNVGILITVLRFGIRQCLLLFIVSIAVAALASFLPVRKIAAKRPIDAIRNR